MWWRCRESNPGPPSPYQDFSVRSSLCLYLAPPVSRTSRCDEPSRSELSRSIPRPNLTVEPPSRCRIQGRRPSLPDRVAPRSGGEGELALTLVGAYLFAATLSVVSRLHRHASLGSTSGVETVHPLVAAFLPAAWIALSVTLRPPTIIPISCSAHTPSNRAGVSCNTDRRNRWPSRASDSAHPAIARNCSL